MRQAPRWKDESISLQNFFNANRALCRAIEPYLPQANPNPFVDYGETVIQHVNSRPSQIVIDIGGGKSCPFAKLVNAASNARIVAVDISGEELRQNREVGLRVVGNLMGEIPLASEAADIIVSRSVLEHLEDVDSFMRECFRVLKAGGRTIHLLPSKYALFAILNRMLPNAVSKRLIALFHPGSAGICGFPAFYDRCYFSAMKRLFEQNGFRIVRMEVGYDQSGYYSFFLPFYLLSALYEMLVHALRLRNLGAHVLVVAEKPQHVLVK